MVLALALTASGCQELRVRRAVQEANALHDQGRFREAAARYAEAARTSPELPVLYKNMGFNYLYLFSPSAKGPENARWAAGAVAAFTRYLELSPGDEKVRGYLISTWIDSGRVDDALAFFRRRLERAPGDVEAVSRLALISSKAGRFDDALSWYERRAALEPRDPDAHYAIGVTIWERLFDRKQGLAGAERLRLAGRGLDALRTADRLRPDHPDTLTYLDLVLRERALGHVQAASAAAGAAPTPAAALASAEAARARDLAEADGYQRRALALHRPQGGVARPGVAAALGMAPGAR